MDLMFRSLSFHVGFLGSLCLLDSIYSGPSASKTASATTLESSVGSSSEVESPVSIKHAESKGNLADPLNEISYNLDFKDESDLPCQIGGSKENLDCNSYFNSEEDLTALYDGVSYRSEEEWMSGLELEDDEPTIFSSKPNYSNNTCR
jgi:hypothetical protein